MATLTKPKLNLHLGSYAHAKVYVHACIYMHSNVNTKGNFGVYTYILSLHICTYSPIPCDFSFEGFLHSHGPGFASLLGISGLADAQGAQNRDAARFPA